MPAADMVQKRLRDPDIGLPNPEITVHDYIPLSVHNRVAYPAGQIPKRPAGIPARSSASHACPASRQCFSNAPLR